MLIVLFGLIFIGSSTAAKAVSPANHVAIVDTVYTQVDTQPEYPGGIGAFYKLVGQIVRYPREDRDRGIQGTVIVTFVVEPDGALSNIKAVRGPSEALKQEAVRVVTVLSATKWQPGVKDGQAVRAIYTIPLKFAYQSFNTETDQNKVFDNPFRQVEFPGGAEALGDFISENIRYPKDDLDKGLTGKVMLSLIVEPDGSLTHIKATEGPSEAMKAEAIRLMKTSPKWKPGVMNDGMAVRVSYNLPVEFKLPAAQSK
ncbi:energy transducer TonB [Mucilaginibacter sp. dw_454]|uniref:energy transducer TonB n=1 Tax=Mucilaginibacter sp. dw_454 TaxID=2720079 RepID=UPI001BD1D5BA|nr:energy transducer TonB [Mucilaginibacter sp. dw_454]